MFKKATTNKTNSQVAHLVCAYVLQVFLVRFFVVIFVFRKIEGFFAPAHIPSNSERAEIKVTPI